MVDLAQALSEIKSLPDQALQQELASPSGMIPGYLVLGEMHERKRLRASTGPAPTQRPSMAEEYIGSARKAFAGAGLAGQSRPPEMPPPQQPPQMQGLSSLPPQAPQGYAAGGIVSIARPYSKLSMYEKLLNLDEYMREGLGDVEESHPLYKKPVRPKADPDKGIPNWQLELQEKLGNSESLMDQLQAQGLQEEFDAVRQRNVVPNMLHGMDRLMDKANRPNKLEDYKDYILKKQQPLNSIGFVDGGNPGKAYTWADRRAEPDYEPSWGEWLGIEPVEPGERPYIEPELRSPPQYTDEGGNPASRTGLIDIWKMLGLREEKGYADGGIVGLPNYARGGVVYSNQGATRNQQLTANLYQQLNDALANVYGSDYGLQVYSGGQPLEGAGRVGSHRHDLGRAADVYVVDPSGNRLTGDALAPLAQYWRTKGIGGVGLEMAGGGVHLDEWATPPQGGGMAWTYGNVTPAQQAALYGASGDNTSAGNAGGGMTIEQYIRARAPVYGVDPDIALQVARSEGGLKDWVRQSEVVNSQGIRETSYGPFQLYVGGGLGDKALKMGIDPRDPAQAWKGVDFALAEAGAGGWGPWHGWKGDPMAGISGQGSRTPIFDMNPMTAAAYGTAQASGVVGQQAAETAGQMAAAETADPLSAMMMLNKLGGGQPQPQAPAASAPMPMQTGVIDIPRRMAAGKRFDLTGRSMYG